MDCSLFTFIVPLYPSGSIETATHFPFLILQVFPILMTKENLQMIWSIYIKTIRAYKTQIETLSENHNQHSGLVYFKSAKLHAWRGSVLTCFLCLRAYVLSVLACLRALCTCVRVCVRACYDEMFYFLTCLRTWCAFLSYLLYISVLKFKNSHRKKLVCFVDLNIFLICILIPTYKTI